MSGVAGFDMEIDWVTFFIIAVVTLIVLNMHLGISYQDMLLPFREWIPGLMGFDVMIGLSLLILFFKSNWGKLGWATTFIFVFALIWLIS